MSRLAIMLFMVLGAIAGCSSRQLYDTGQSYQRNQCERLIESGDRQRCLERADMRYEDYKRETQPDSR